MRNRTDKCALARVARLAALVCALAIAAAGALSLAALFRAAL